MKPYYLLCDNANHHTLREATPLDSKSIVAVFNLTEPQLETFKKFVNEFNQKHNALALTAEMRHVQKKYYTAKRNGVAKFTTDTYLSNALEIERQLDKSIYQIDKNFGKLFKDPNELNLF